MKNKTTKNLIILGAILFYFTLANSASAYCQLYAFTNKQVDRNCVNTPSYADRIVAANNARKSGSSAVLGTTVVNNYYNTNPSTTSNTSTTTNKTNTKSTSNVSSTQKTNEDTTVENNSGPAGVNGSDITALSFKGSGGFMPSSIWQWFLVIILILIIIVIARSLVNKPKPGDAHAAHAH